MRPWVKVDAAETPGGAIVLWQRGDEFRIHIDGQDLMGSQMHGSEDALGAMGCDGLRPDARVLVGGLGMGFTLAAALGAVGPAATVVVAEANPVVVRWNEAHLGGLAGHPLRDPRVSLRVREVQAVWRDGPWDAILLDVDNGPDALSRPDNAGLYDATGLWMARSSLRKGGRLVVWSVSDDRAFTRRLRAAGFDVQQARVPAWPGSKRTHLLWIATVAAASRPAAGR